MSAIRNMFYAILLSKMQLKLKEKSMINNIKRFSILIIIVLLPLLGCTKEVPKEMQNTNKLPGVQQTEMPNDSIHKNLGMHNEKVDLVQDSMMVSLLTKEADEADAKYKKTKSEADKKDAIIKQMQAANYLMNQAESISQKVKYRSALKRYRRVLELDPNNEEAKGNKKIIEDIYTQMGRPIPE